MKKSLFLSFILISAIVLLFSGCQKGENDPFLTLHSRDARMSQPWKLSSFSGTIVTTKDNITSTTTYQYDGENLTRVIDGNTEGFIYTYTMNIEDDGHVTSSEVYNQQSNPTGTPIFKSSKTSYWYWGDDNDNKTSVNLDLTGIFENYPSYDIPRLAWNDMTLSVSYYDTFTENIDDTTSVTTTQSVELELNFDVDLDVINGTN